MTASTRYGTLALDPATGAYSFAADPDAIDALGAGMTATASFTVQVKYEHGAASAPVALTFNLVGANDTASISGAGSGSVGEDATLAATGSLAVQDRDSGEAVFAAPATLSGTYGDFVFDQQTGQWAYALRNGDANVQALGAGKVVTDDLVVTSLDGTASASLHVQITGANDAASISGDATGVLAEDGTLSAGGILMVHDADAGEARFIAPASLAGTYGDFSFDEQTGQWAYALRNADANVQALGAGKVVADEIVVTSLDGSASATLHVQVMGANDAASISGAATGAVAEDGTLTAGGILAVQDADAGEAGFATPASLAGAYGDFSFDTGTGVWSYALRNGDAGVQALATGQQVFDQLVVASRDGSASQTIRVSVAGADEPASVPGDTNPVRTFQVNRGQADSDGRIYYSGFDDNDLLAYSGNLTYVGHGLADTNGDGVTDASTATFEFSNNGGKVSHVVVILIGYTGLSDAQLTH
jgi:VCBS repeat-containing protein